MQRCLGCMRTYDTQYALCPHCGYVRDSVPGDSNQLPPGTVLQNRYTLGRALGRGGFGITYIAWDSRLEQAVAIKEYLPGVFASRTVGRNTVSCYSENARAQFTAGLQKTLRESRMLAQFSHLDGVVRVFDCFEENETAYIVMELLRGQTVSEMLKQSGAMPLQDVLRIMEPILRALGQIHQTGLIHRDVAPDNIFVCDDGKVKLLDFGAARVSSDMDEHTLSIVLKHGYAPIEQYSSRGRQGPYTDVYAAGATIYKMLTGQTPPSGLDRMQQDDLRPVQDFVRVPDPVQRALQHSMALRAADRTQSAEQLLLELTGAAARKNAPAAGQKPHKTAHGAFRNTALPILLGIAAALLVAGAVLGLRHFRSAADVPAETQTEPAPVLADMPETLPASTAHIADPDNILKPASIRASADQGSGGYGRSYGAQMAADGDFNTCWMVAGKQDGIGNWIELQFDAPTAVSGIQLLNGNGWDGYYQGQKVQRDLFSLNGRVRDFTLTFSDGSARTFTARDVREETFGANRFFFDEPITTTSIRLTIDSGYSGSKWTTVCCLSEIAAFY